MVIPTDLVTIAVVEMVTKRREPLPTLAGVYFISATESSVKGLIDDFKYNPLYKSAHVFFSSRVPPGVLTEIRNCSGLTARLKTLKEVTPTPTSPAFCIWVD